MFEISWPWVFLALPLPYLLKRFNKRSANIPTLRIPSFEHNPLLTGHNEQKTQKIVNILLKQTKMHQKPTKTCKK